MDGDKAERRRFELRLWYEKQELAKGLIKQKRFFRGSYVVEWCIPHKPSWMPGVPDSGRGRWVAIQSGQSRPAGECFRSIDLLFPRASRIR